MICTVFNGEETHFVWVNCLEMWEYNKPISHRGETCHNISTLFIQWECYSQDGLKNCKTMYKKEAFKFVKY